VIARCIAGILLLLVVSMLIGRSWIVSLVLATAYGTWALTRPRMVRIFRRLRGEPSWSNYFDSGARLQLSPGPGTGASPRHPAERR
jgi:hypothetical protein